jgi:hypothetical protein
MNEIDEILDYLEYISQQKRSVSLVNTYKGVSVSLEVNIQQILRKRGDVVVVAQYGHSISLLPATQILIHSDLFPNPIEAKVASVDVHHRTAVLRNFSYHQSKKDNRKESRVQPKSVINASVTIDGQNVRNGKIFDISVEGISLILKSNNTDLTQIYLPNTSVRVIYTLSISNELEPVNIYIPAKVSHAHIIHPSGEYRVGFMTFPKEEQRSVLRRFIFDCQTELFSDFSQNTPTRPGTSMIG